ncbi:MAG: glycosyltransferase [Proteobacteria bacterium]|nr:glycosyltransferase [Pseudomonadota bacterium]
MERSVYKTIEASTHTVVPSRHAKRLFPYRYHDRISVLPDGFRLPDPRVQISDPRRRPYRVGFAARDLSSAKGIEHFLQIAGEICKMRDDVEFVLFGGAKTPYGYEANVLNNIHGKNHSSTFVGYLLQRDGVDLSRFVFHGYLCESEFLDRIREVDLFLYPLQFGSFNWGLFSLLSQGRVVIASQECYLPEVLTDGQDGFMVPLRRIEAWVELACALLDDPDRRAAVGRRAVETYRKYRIELVAPRFLELMSRLRFDASPGPTWAGDK